MIQIDMRTRALRTHHPGRVWHTVATAIGTLLLSGQLCHAVITKINVVRDQANTNTATMSIDASAAAAVSSSADGTVSGFFCDTIVAAIVLPDGQTANIISVTPGTFDEDQGAVSPAHKAALEAELVSAGLFNDAVQDLYFFRYFRPEVTCPSILQADLVFEVFDVSDEFQQNPLSLEGVAMGATTLSDLTDGSGDLERFGADQTVVLPSGNVPAASTWALVAMALALLAGARLRFGRRQVKGI